LWAEALLSRPDVMVSGVRPADERAWLMSPSTWSAALLDEVPAGLEADDGDEEDEDADGDEEDDAGAEAEDDGAEPEEEADGDDEGPPATGCPGRWFDAVEWGDCAVDGLAVT
jgi:hypothetical protein